MPVIPSSSRTSGLRAIRFITIAAVALWLLLAPQPARANVSCSANPNPPAVLDFGTSATVTGTIGYSCTNFGTTLVNVNLCIGVGTPSYPGTTAQPAMQGPAGAALNFNVYTDVAATVVWTSNNPISRTVSLPGNSQPVTGTFNYYGRIASGQSPPLGTYQAFFYNTSIGFVSGGVCATNVADLAGVTVTLTVNATKVAACTFGTNGAIDFGTQPGLWNRVDAAGSVQLTCPSGVAWTLSFDAGGNSSGSERQMRSATGNFVIYRIYSDAARSSQIVFNGTMGGTGTGAVQSRAVYGRVDPTSPPPPGTYTDRIVLTLSF